MKKFLRFVALCIALCLVAGLMPPVQMVSAAAAPLNVLDYGAAGDGVTDDHEAIQAAIDAATAGAGDGVICFPKGRYLAGDIIQLKSNITLQLDDEAVIVNGLNYSSGPIIIFMTGLFIRGGAKQTWDGVENVTISGGTIDMNGILNADGTASENLPLSSSAGGLALGYSKNIRIENVDFLNCYKGHVMQICACDGVTVTGCNFRGQSLTSDMTDSKMNNLELIQIEPSTINGFPYAANETGEASQNITIENCYFGASDDCGEPSVAIGTHNQVVTADKCNNISILNNTFDNMRYAGVRFCGYEDVTIRGNTFIKKTESQTTNYRADGCFLINAYCYNNTTDELDLNRRITIENNTFQIADPVTRPIRVAKDSDTYLGTVTDITIRGNSITNTSTGSKDLGIQAMRISNNLTITGNTIRGGYRGVEVQYCTGNITINSNDISGLNYQYVRFIACGDNQKINVYTHGEGTAQVSTANGNYTITAVPNAGSVFSGYYKENALTNLVTMDAALTFSISAASAAYRHPLFEACAGHTLITQKTAPTCTKDGCTTYTCTICAYSYSETIAATGHSYVGGICGTCGAADPDYVEPVTVPTLTLVAPSLNFEDEIYYNVYYTASDMTDVVEMGLITFDSYLAEGTIDDAAEVIPGYTESGSNYMSHTNGIPSMKLGDALYFRVYAKLSDGTYAYSPTAAYHAVAYAKDILANSTNERMKALVVAMLNYGAAAQVHFEYKTDALVNSFLTDEQKALVSEYSSDMVDSIVAADSSKTGNFKAVSGGYSALAPSVVFEGAFSINYYFTPAKTMDGELKLYYWKLDDYNAADVLTADNATSVVTMEETSDAGQYLGAVPGIAAKQIDQTVYVCGVYESDGVTYCTGVIAYSLAAYCLDRISKGTETMKAFATETVVYGYYAKQYFA